MFRSIFVTPVMLPVDVRTRQVTAGTDTVSDTAAIDAESAAAVATATSAAAAAVAVATSSAAVSVCDDAAAASVAVTTSSAHNIADDEGRSLELNAVRDELQRTRTELDEAHEALGSHVETEASLKAELAKMREERNALKERLADEHIRLSQAQVQKQLMKTQLNSLHEQVCARAN